MEGYKSWPNLRQYPSISLWRPRKTMNNHDSLSLKWDLKLGTPEYEQECYDERLLKFGQTLVVGTSSNSHSIRTATKLICVAWTPLEFRSSCRSVTVWTTTIFGVLASTAFCIWTTGSCSIVWTTAISTILAATTCKKPVF